MTYLDPNYKGERLAKVIARCGYCSRREAEELIKNGQVKVNGKIVTNVATNITDESIKINNKLLNKKQRTRLWLFNKPKGVVVSTTTDKKIPTIFDILPKKMPRVISIGRLDINTEGLILLTNNGELSEYISSPRTAWHRQYRVRVFGKINQDRFDKIAKNGLVVNGFRYKPAKITIEKTSNSANSWLNVTLTEGKNREIKNIMSALGLQVTRLIRIKFGPFFLNDLKSGDIYEVPFQKIKEYIGNNVKLN